MIVFIYFLPDTVGKCLSSSAENIYRTLIHFVNCGGGIIGRGWHVGDAGSAF